MKNIEKVFYMICGVALVFVGIIIGRLIENDANAQTEPNPEYKVVKEEFPNLNMRVQKSINGGVRVEKIQNMLSIKWLLLVGLQMM